MNKSVLGVIGAVIAFVVIGVVLWVTLGSSKSAITPETAPSATDLTASSKVDIKIFDSSFTPPNIKVKKGTQVTWTNQDTIGHSVVADDPANAGGLPTSHPTFGRGQTFVATFDQAGTFKYHCSAHSFMHGSVQVVE
jgi:plastocyanin